ncbi:deoxyribose-phosphate aldolase [Flavobacterium ardleyense]|uniref:Deoxyribose-phosphate aldolase n=1 Tax=Flavobacterium ardleyense TaxID=2038737 RepID=A0ABW5Z845_9FLAO
MDVKHYLDSTYLKTAEQANLSEEKNTEVVAAYIQEAIDHHFKLIMIRPDKVALAKEMVLNSKSQLTIGTVIDFPNGDGSLENKLKEANLAIQNGADDLDFVVDYKAFINEEFDKVKKQVLEGTELGLQHHKIVKWIIEVAALNDHQIIQLSVLIKNVIIANFKEADYEKVFVKSSTGFYKTPEGVPNGATLHTIKLMLENSFPLSVKAAGGVRTYQEAVEMINLGVKRIGTSAAKAIANGEDASNGY